MRALAGGGDFNAFCIWLQSAPVSKGGRKSGSKVCCHIPNHSGLAGIEQAVYRDFVLSQYQHLKKANPKFPILIRECSGAEARLIARYGKFASCLGHFPHDDA